LCPFGGGSQRAFRTWKALAGWDIGVSLVIYPGREHRAYEAPCPSIAPLAAELVDELVSNPPFRRSWLLVGHSLGALVAFEACRTLERCGQPPSGLVLSACPAAHLRPRIAIGHLNDEELVERLIAAGGCPPELRDDAELRAFYLPILRCDFIASEGHHAHVESKAEPLETRAHLLYGLADEEATRDEVAAWQRWFSSPVELNALPGNHFYLTQHPDAFLRLALRALVGELHPTPSRDVLGSNDFP
jgi:thioesterase component of yersiniabactin synthetase